MEQFDPLYDLALYSGANLRIGIAESYLERFFASASARPMIGHPRMFISLTSSGKHKMVLRSP